jgi:hypothetical protein
LLRGPLLAQLSRFNSVEEATSQPVVASSLFSSWRVIAKFCPNADGGYRPRWIAIAATHITAAAAINTKNGLSVDLADFAMTIPDRSHWRKSYS